MCRHLERRTLVRSSLLRPSCLPRTTVRTGRSTTTAPTPSRAALGHLRRLTRSICFEPTSPVLGGRATWRRLLPTNPWLSATNINRVHRYLGALRHSGALTKEGETMSICSSRLITIRCTSSATVTQGESSWLDLAPYQDVSFYLDVREFTGTTPTIQFQTAPIKDETLFQAMLSSAITLTLSPSIHYRGRDYDVGVPRGPLCSLATSRSSKRVGCNVSRLSLCRCIGSLMYGVLLQDWTTIEGASSVTTLNQTDAFWLDTSAYLDVVTFLQVATVSSASIAYQVSPTRDETLFQSMASLTPSVGVTVGVYLRDTAAYPLSHWLRWQLSGAGSAWNITFRVCGAQPNSGGFARAVAQDGGVGAESGGPAWTNAPGTGILPNSNKPSILTSTIFNTRAQLAPGGNAPPNVALNRGAFGPGVHIPLSNRWVPPPPPQKGPATRAPTAPPTQQPVAWNPFLAPGTKVTVKP